MNKTWTLAARLRIAVAAILLGFVLLIALLSSRSSDSLMAVKMLNTVDQTQAAEAIARGYYDKAKSGVESGVKFLEQHPGILKPQPPLY